ncbi:MAG: pre-peptidase C-terminal domain-containing protein [Chloroflexi bacterium]|nr:pre-peptidase C-terminal domain-containing protein [Chloroflexota bacterium]
MLKKAIKIVLLVGLVSWSFLNSHMKPIAAQDDAAQRINALAEAVHIQNLRTHNVTRWRGGDLGQMNGSEINAPAGTVFADWQFADLYDDTIQIDTSAMTRPVAINIWASWCGPCRFEFPFLAEIARAGGLDYDLWFLDANDTPDAAQRFVRDEIENGSEGLNLYYDTSDAYISQIGLQVFPTTLLIDTDGTILLAHSGVVTRTVMEFFNAVAAAPREGSIDTSTIDVPELVATLDPVDAANATPIVYYQQVTGEITDEKWQDVYSFEGKAGDEITLDMTSTEPDFDAYLVLFGPDGNRLAENDDGPNPPYSQIQFTLPADGTYVVVATRFLERDGFVAGGYNLVVSKAGAEVGNQIIFDIPISARLTTDYTQAAYLMDAKAGQILTFTLEHDTPTEVLHLEVRLGAGDRVVPFQSSENGSLTYEATMPQDGTYSVYVSRPMRSRAGAITFTLAVSGVNPDGTPATNGLEATGDTGTGGTSTGDTDQTGTGSGSAGDAQVEGTLTYGDSVTGSIDDNTPFHIYEFEGRVGDAVVIHMAADASRTLDTQLTLYGPDGTLRGANDDADMTTTDSEITYTLTDDGTYQIVASRYLSTDGTSFGDFTLSLTLGTGETNSGGDTTTTPPTVSNPPAGDVEGLEIEYGTTVVGAIDSANLEQRYVFTGTAGDVVTISMSRTDGDLDSYLSVFDASGHELVFNDEDIYSIGNDAAIRQFKLPADGTYTIVATRYGAFNGISAGSYELILSTENIIPGD